MIPEAQELRTGLAESLRSVFDRICLDLVVAGGCDPHVEATSVGFTCNGATVAVVYPRRTFLEVALALPSDIEGSGFKEATQLASPATPVFLEVRTEDDLERCLGHLVEALERVRSDQHGVRPPDHFTRRTRRGTGTPEW